MNTTPTVDFEELLEYLAGRLVEAGIPGITEANLVLPREELSGGRDFFVTLACVGGGMTMTSEHTSRRPVQVQVMVCSGNPGAAGRKQCSAAAAGIVRAFPAMDAKRSNFEDKYGNRFMIGQTDVLAAEADGNVHRVHVRLTLRMDVLH